MRHPHYAKCWISLDPSNRQNVAMVQWWNLKIIRLIIWLIIIQTNHLLIHLLSCPSIDWEQTWTWSRLKWLGSPAISFLWKLLHQLLPTEYRLSRILPNSTPDCKLCPGHVQADLVHCFFHCDNTRVMGGKLLSAISPHYPLITLSKLLRLDFEAEPAMEMPLVWVTAHTLQYMWGVRCSGKTVNPLLTRASLESKISLLRETRFQNEHTLVKQVVAKTESFLVCSNLCTSLCMSS